MPGPVAPVIVRAQRATGSTPANTVRGRFRPDIEGLRGLAVLLVVVFHAWPELLTGGFIGVDVFFVISGFLITGLLYRELGSTGHISFSGFYLRRIRRLFPAAALAVGGILVLSAWLLSPLALPRVAADGVAAALSVSNIRFALTTGDYFSAVATPSPFLHFWSLSVEEQFYLVWPALLLVVYRLGGVRLVAAAVALIAVGSLLLALIMTDAAPTWAFYSLLTRAWQLALGGLLAIAALERWRRGPVSAGLATIGWVGLGLVLLGGLLLDDLSAYPGTWALLPTLGAVALIAGGDRRGGPGLLLGTVPFRFLGRISYALYLWHWPLLVLAAAAFGAELSLGMRAGLVALSVLIATASTLLVEEPIRRRTSLAVGRRKLRMAATPLLALALALFVGLGATSWVVERTLGQVEGEATTAAGPPEDVEGDAVIEGFDRRDHATPKPAATTPRPPRAVREPPARLDPTARPTPRPKQTHRPKVTPKPTPTPKPKPKPRKTPKPAPDWSLPRDVRPSLVAAPEDYEALKRNACLHDEAATSPKSCVFANASSRYTLALVGDSHASHWFPALQRVADERGWRLETYVKVSCPFSDILVRNLEKKKKYKACLAFNEAVVARLKASKPDVVVTAVSRWQHPIDEAYDSPYAQGEGIARVLKQVPGKKVVIADVPYPGLDVPECLARNLKDIRVCAAPARNRLAGGSPARERQAANSSGGVMLDFYDLICKNHDRCLPIRNDMIVWRDHHHLTATFSRSLAPALDRALQKVVPKRMRG